MEIDLVMYVLFLVVGFGLGILTSMGFFLHRMDHEKNQRVDVTLPKVEVNVSSELVARYLDACNLVAIPKELIVGTDETGTRH